ncbi:MAG: fumarylacetoacetate hydrolase family protein [bacterium]|jgi:hypothetical protein|nr:fumarylacetoacetate hydrolase family protein [Betaproteobacteria bacterium]
MKLVRFNALGEPVARARTGVLLPDGRVGDLRAALATALVQDGRDALGREIAALRIPPDVRLILHNGPPAWAAMEHGARWLTERCAAEPDPIGADGEPLVHALAKVRLHNPLKPGRLVLVAGNRKGHPARPHLLQRAPATVMGPVRDIDLPAGIHALQYATGLAIVIARNCHGLTADTALQAIAGYMTANEVRSATGALEGLEGDATFSRYIIGPALVSPEHVHGIATATLTTRINDQPVQTGSLANLQVPIAELVAQVSRLGLEAGDVIVTGLLAETTGPGLAAGDRIEATVEGLGSTHNRVVAGA